MREQSVDMGSLSLVVSGTWATSAWRTSRKTLAFYRDCPAPGAGGARLYRAVTIEPFEVSRWRGGCGGLLWDFNQAGSMVASRCGRFGARAVAFGWA